jgi:hypothetical protein
MYNSVLLSYNRIHDFKDRKKRVMRVTVLAGALKG